jgi:hypothetical protein
MAKMSVQELHNEIAHALGKLSDLFVPGMKLSFMARMPGNGEADVLVGDDHDADEMIALIHRRLGAPSSATTAGHIAPTPRVEAVIAEAMEKYAGGTPGRDLTYYQNVHQDLAPLARQLERELDRAKAELVELRAQVARSAGDAAQDAGRYRHIRDSSNNGYDLRGPAGVGKWHVSRKVCEGEGEYLWGRYLDNAIDQSIGAAPAPGNTAQPSGKEE